MVRVKVQNFQSIKEAEIVVDGLTVITGPNNSGKTSLMRAIRGVFENSPHGSLLRKGEDKMEVYLEFDDGRTVLWEKGPKDNSYTIDGYKISGVGRGAPEELRDLGVFPISAANNVLWPQVAKQFEGTLFLVNKTGSVIAEALSDIDKVGKLTKALRLSEKDKRAVSGELKVRRKDLISQKEIVEKYEGFDEVENLFEDLKKRKESLEKERDFCIRASSLRSKLKSCRQALQRFEGVENISLPNKESKLAQRIKQAFDIAGTLAKRKRENEAEIEQYSFLEEVSLPVISRKPLQRLASVSSLSSKVKTSRLEFLKYKDFQQSTQLPFPEKERKTLSSIKNIKVLSRNKIEKTSEVDRLENEFSTVRDNLEKVERLISEDLGSLGECPLCKKPHEVSCG